MDLVPAGRAGEEVRGLAAVAAVVMVGIALLAGGCEGKGRDASKAKLEELSAKIVALESENGRLKEQVALLIETNEKRTEVLAAKDALPPAVPTVVPSPSPSPSSSPSGTPKK